MEVLEEAIQAAALEADFTFPDDSASSNGDQSLIIDDIIESLESDALEAEQEALEVRRVEEEAQVGICNCNMHVLPDIEPVLSLPVSSLSLLSLSLSHSLPPLCSVASLLPVSWIYIVITIVITIALTVPSLLFTLILTPTLTSMLTSSPPYPQCSHQDQQCHPAHKFASCKQLLSCLPACLQLVWKPAKPASSVPLAGACHPYPSCTPPYSPYLVDHYSIIDQHSACYALCTMHMLECLCDKASQ